MARMPNWPHASCRVLGQMTSLNPWPLKAFRNLVRRGRSWKPRRCCSCQPPCHATEQGLLPVAATAAAETADADGNWNRENPVPPSSRSEAGCCHAWDEWCPAAAVVMLLLGVVLLVINCEWELLQCTCTVATTSLRSASALGDGCSVQQTCHVVISTHVNQGCCGQVSLCNTLCHIYCMQMAACLVWASVVLLLTSWDGLTTPQALLPTAAGPLADGTTSAVAR
jgi:hypothetical protein